jgi:hypothetical protein
MGLMGLTGLLFASVLLCACATVSDMLVTEAFKRFSAMLWLCYSFDIARTLHAVMLCTGRKLGLMTFDDV